MFFIYNHFLCVLYIYLCFLYMFLDTFRKWALWEVLCFPILCFSGEYLCVQICASDTLPFDPNYGLLTSMRDEGIHLLLRASNYTKSTSCDATKILLPYKQRLLIEGHRNLYLLFEFLIKCSFKTIERLFWVCEFGWPCVTNECLHPMPPPPLSIRKICDRWRRNRSLRSLLSYYSLFIVRNHSLLLMVPIESLFYIYETHYK